MYSEKKCNFENLQKRRDGSELIHGFKNSYVLKLGGSLMKDSDRILNYLKRKITVEDNTLYDYDDLKNLRVIIIPGGGSFADMIRETGRSHGLDDENLHWMAILAMEQYGYLLKSETGIPVFHDFEEIENSDEVICILLPYGILRKYDPLPHNWDVTSDSIAAWIAGETGSRYIKATDVDGILKNGNLIDSISTKDLKKEIRLSCTDPYLPFVLEKYSIDCIIINGRYPHRFIEYITEHDTTGTCIYVENPQIDIK